MTKLATHLYVVAGNQPAPAVSGFLHAYNPKKPDDKKHQTQRDWAYDQFKDGVGYVWDRDAYYKDLAEIRENEKPGDPYKFPDRKFIVAPFQPQIWENTPQEGFEILDMVARYRGNKLWVVKDPRGLIVELTTISFSEIVANCTIVKGVLQGKFVWKSSKNLIPA